MTTKHLRKRLFVDRDVQGGIALRATRYWMFSIAFVGMLTVVGWVFVSPGLAALVRTPETLRSTLACLATASAVSALLLPAVIYDLVRFSHRFVGPLVRLKDAMRRAAAGESVEPIRFREDDYWQDLAEAFNAMQARIESPAKANGVERGDHVGG